MENHPDWDITRIIALLETEMGGIDAETAGHDVTKEAEAPCKAGRLSLAGRLARAVGLDRGQLRAPGRAVVAAGLAASILTAYFLADAAISGMSKSADSTGLAQAQFASGKAAYESVLSSYGERDRAETSGDTIRMRATAYDLSYESCGKLPGDPGYGITFSGNRAVPGRTIAVDPKVIPIGSRVYITFPEEYSGMDGIYRAEDTGRLISGNSVDIFFGEDKNGSTKINESAMKFGVRYVDVRLID